MRLLRVRFTIRGMMIAVLIIALACGWFALWNARRLRRKALEAEAIAQGQVTTAVFREALAEFGTSGRQSKEGGSFASSPDGARWDKMLKAWEGIDIHQVPVIDIEARGGSDGSALEPVSIEGHGGPLCARVIEKLARTYDARGWRYNITSPTSAGEEARASREQLLRVDTPGSGPETKRER